MIFAVSRGNPRRAGFARKLSEKNSPFVVSHNRRGARSILNAPRTNANRYGRHTLLEWYSKVNRAVTVRDDSRAALAFRVSPEGKLMPLPAPPVVAYPRHTVTDDLPTTEKTLSARFFESNPAHLIGRRTGSGVWPDDSPDADAKKAFEAGQIALYENKDAQAAITAYEAAVERDAGYIKAWVALSIAYITDNTADSLGKASDVLSFLAELTPGDWLTLEASGIIHQNRAYLSVHRFRQGGKKKIALLADADRDYAVCDTRTELGRERLEYLCPWTYVKIVSGETVAARLLWSRAVTRARDLGANSILAEYVAKYAPLAQFAGEL